MDYIQQNAIRQAATISKAEMEATKDLATRRSIIDRHLAPLKIKFGVGKTELMVIIYKITKGE